MLSQPKRDLVVSLVAPSPTCDKAAFTLIAAAPASTLSNRRTSRRQRRSKSKRAARESEFGSTVRYLTGRPNVATIAEAMSSTELRK
jgi:hypothetical protein